ncbi:putative leader peptide [Streptomyces zagrosensis]|uniref:putative leader peptide n=1 Tax=Streptomyces zagrosensis TaxID=1042984 RepID=UPI0035E4130F
MARAGSTAPRPMQAAAPPPRPPPVASPPPSRRHPAGRLVRSRALPARPCAGSVAPERTAWGHRGVRPCPCPLLTIGGRGGLLRTMSDTGSHLWRRVHMDLLRYAGCVCQPSC